MSLWRTHFRLGAKLNCFRSGLLNLRGSDIDYNPVFYSYAIITRDELHVFASLGQLPAHADQHFKDNQIAPVLHEYGTFNAQLTKAIAENKMNKCWVSPTSGYAVHSLFPQKKIHQDVLKATLPSISNSI